MYAHGFRFYFTPFTRVLFAFPSRYWFTIGRQRVFSLGGWSPHVQTGFHVSRPTRFIVYGFRIRGYHPLWPPFPDVLLTHTQLNWASPRSLAATCGISVDFFSSGYLDVSVLPVRFRSLCIQLRMTLRSGCPIRRSPDHCLLSASRGFSQISTSFFACCRQGIHRVHLFT